MTKHIILSNKIQCKRCRDIIESSSTHDFKMCTCQNVGIDGGKSYLRRIGNPEDYNDLSEVVSEDEDGWFERTRELFTWRTYGKSGKEKAKEIPLCNLTTDHIKAILETQFHIRGTFVEELMQMELAYRKEEHAK